MRQTVLSIVERHLGKHWKQSGDSNISMRCPFHKGGQETRPSFGINTELGIYNCYACHETGTIPKLLRMLGVPEDQVKAETDGIQQEIKDNLEALKLRKTTALMTEDLYRAPVVLPESVLSLYEDNCPTQLVNAGFNWQLLRQLKIGYDLKNNRIIYPIRDLYGNLAGVSGGAAFGQYPKYKVYQGGQKSFDGKWHPSEYGDWFDEKFPNYHLNNRNFLWNFERVYPHLLYRKEVGYLIIVEGYKACLWLLQHGYWNTVALMGSRLSELQKNQIARLQATIVLFLDNDEAGRDGTVDTFKRLQSGYRVLTAKYPADADIKQPDDIKSPADLAAAISQASIYPPNIRR